MLLQFKPTQTILAKKWVSLFFFTKLYTIYRWLIWIVNSSFSWPTSFLLSNIYSVQRKRYEWMKEKPNLLVYRTVLKSWGLGNFDWDCHWLVFIGSDTGLIFYYFIFKERLLRILWGRGESRSFTRTTNWDSFNFLFDHDWVK